MRSRGDFCFRGGLNHRLAHHRCGVTDESLSLGERGWKRNCSAHERPKGSCCDVNESHRMCKWSGSVLLVVAITCPRSSTAEAVVSRRNSLARDANLLVFRLRTWKFFPFSFSCPAALLFPPSVVPPRSLLLYRLPWFSGRFIASLEARVLV